MKRQDKDARLDQYAELLEGSTFAFLTEHGKVRVTQMEKLRAQFEEMGCSMLVVKNTLARIVFERKGIDEISAYLDGPSLLVIGKEEVSPVAKALQKVTRSNPTLKVKAIIFDGKVYPASDFKSFQDMPTKNEIRAKLLSVFKAPISGLVRVINTPQRMVSVLKQYADKQSA
jgi:large subunit ribosomal protein L10